MKTFVLHDGPRYRLVSHGNGLAYSLTQKADSDQLEVFVSGDDALRFEEEMEGYECPHTGADGTSWDATCHYLWDIYADVAQ